MRIVVLAGGLSTEREVSISSGTLVAEALRSKGHEVVLLDVFMGYEENICDIDALFKQNYSFTDGNSIGDDVENTITNIKEAKENPTNSFFLKVSRAVKSGQGIHSSDSTPRQGFRTKTELSRLRARVQELLKQQSSMTLSVSILPITKLRISKTFHRSQAVLSAISVTQ